jgi:hypothetical protein
MGVDVARFGDDSTVIRFRKGRDGRSVSPIRLQGLDTQQVAARVAEEYLRYRADAIFVDGGGVGGGVVDRLRALRIPCFDIQFGGKSDRTDPDEPDTKFANKRAEMYGLMRSWLKIGAIENDEKVKASSPPSSTASTCATRFSWNPRPTSSATGHWLSLTMLTPSPLPSLIPWPLQLAAGGPWAQFETEP